MVGKYTPMHVIYDVKQQDLQNKSSIVVGGHVVDSTKHTTYAVTIKNVYVRLMILISMKNILGLMDVDIGNEIFAASCAESIWSFCGAEFGPKCVAVVILKWDLYGLKTAPNSFQKYSGEFLIGLGFTPSKVYQCFWIHKSRNYEGYYYIATHVDDFVIVANNPSKYMHDIEMHFKVRDITDSPNYYLGK